jgi:hypothetical protein
MSYRARNATDFRSTNAHDDRLTEIRFECRHFVDPSKIINLPQRFSEKGERLRSSFADLSQGTELATICSVRANVESDERRQIELSVVTNTRGEISARGHCSRFVAPAELALVANTEKRIWRIAIILLVRDDA